MANRAAYRFVCPVSGQAANIDSSRKRCAFRVYSREMSHHYIPGRSTGRGVPAKEHQAGRHAGGARGWRTTGVQGDPAGAK
jgi:hypothetical protein